MYNQQTKVSEAVLSTNSTSRTIFINDYIVYLQFTPNTTTTTNSVLIAIFQVNLG